MPVPSRSSEMETDHVYGGVRSPNEPDYVVSMVGWSCLGLGAVWMALDIEEGTDEGLILGLVGITLLMGSYFYQCN
jgi:hypothetical protein